MGLDMYLRASLYVSQYDWKKIREQQAYGKSDEWEKSPEYLEALTGFPEGLDKFGESGLIKKVGVAYWRKANQIHNWFVENVQKGEDECREHYVSRDDLQELLDLCKKVNQDNNLAAELLPPTDGFFFGGTELDEWYFEQIEDTIKMLEHVLSFTEIDEFSYQSSW